MNRTKRMKRKRKKKKKMKTELRKKLNKLRLAQVP